MKSGIEMDTRGFTLLELVMVVVIVAVVGALAIPNLDGWFARRQLDEVARTMFSHFQLARSEAIRDSKDVQIRIDLSNDWYDIRDTVGNMVVPQTTMPTSIELFDITTVVTSTGLTSTGLTSRGFATQPVSIAIFSSRANISDNRRIVSLTLGGSVSIQP
ncbi:MAG: GspH/FimT family pseudopilin [Desulfomonilia bacterium]|nr:GspH/FimT family pseudopilin [Desulfomonilia bacterium]